MNKIVLEMVLFQVKMILELEKTINKLKKDGLSSRYEKEYSSQDKKINNDIDKLRKLKKVSYEDWKFEKISK